MPIAMNFQAAKEYILNRLSVELPKDLYYHGVHHTLDVCQSVDEIASGENIIDDDLVLLRTAAIYHDIGFVEAYQNNEAIAVTIAQHTLPSFDYSPEQIYIIANIILSTGVPQTPDTLLEKIMCDADLDYLGREDFFEIATTLKNEWLAFHIIDSEAEWDKRQLTFLEHHQYFTSTSRKKRDAQKKIHLAEIKQRL